MNNTRYSTAIHERIHPSDGSNSAPLLVEGSYSLDICPSQFGSSVRFACFVERPSLGFHVLHIVSMGTKKEMLWIDAQSVVAMVTDAHAFWNMTYEQLPSDAMRQLRTSLEADRSVPAASASTANQIWQPLGPLTSNFSHELGSGPFKTISRRAPSNSHAVHYSFIY